MSKNHIKNITIALICLILGLTLSWQYKSIQANKSVDIYTRSTEDELIKELLNERKNIENLRLKNDELQQTLQKYEQATSEYEKMKILNTELEEARMVAGKKSVKGKGIIITITETNESYVYASDLFAIVNQLKASDVQAISINEERIIATTEIVKGGSYIVVNGRQITHPYVIKAIGDPDNMINSLTIAEGPIDNITRWFIDVKIDKSDNVVISKARDELFKTDLMNTVE